MQVHYDIPGILGLFMEFMLVAIVLGFGLIALQYWLRRKDAVDREQRLAFGQLFFIFVFSGMSGYLPRLTAFPLPLLVFSHAFLFGFTWYYVLSRQAVVIADALNKASEHDGPAARG